MTCVRNDSNPYGISIILTIRLIILIRDSNGISIILTIRLIILIRDSRL